MDAKVFCKSTHYARISSRKSRVFTRLIRFAPDMGHPSGAGLATILRVELPLGVLDLGVRRDVVIA